jgi:hypothetical protein
MRLQATFKDEISPFSTRMDGENSQGWIYATLRKHRSVLEMVPCFELVSRADRQVILQKEKSALEIASCRIIGTGEMADLVRDYDWNSTPLGPIEAWSK